VDAPSGKPSPGGGCGLSALGFWTLAFLTLALSVGVGIQVGRQLGVLHGIAVGFVVYLLGGMAFLAVVLGGVPKRESDRRR